MSTSLIATLAPERASSTASACPMPEPAPVTAATFPANPCMSTLLVSWLLSRLAGTRGTAYVARVEILARRIGDSP